jgi:hypothetical protein
MKNILYLVRTEADFERAVAFGIAGKNKYKQSFVFVGDFSPFYADGIKNKFQKSLFTENGLIIRDFCDYDFIGRILKKLSSNQSISIQKVRANKSLFIPYLFYILFTKYVNIRKYHIIENIFIKTKPDIFLTDQSMTTEKYLPEIFRKASIRNGIPVFLYHHGAAGGLHSAFSNPHYEPYENCTVLACSQEETNPELSNRIILGDVSSSYPYVHYLNNKKLHDLSFLDDRKYKVAFIMGGAATFSSTNGWHVQEEIIIELSENSDVAMVLKLHPRESNFVDLRILEKFNNLLIVNKETDRSRVTKWADIIVCGDHCSTIFEPMILGKKVVAIEGKHIPKYKNNHSPLKYSSVLHISNSNEFNIDSIPNANPLDEVTNKIAWGRNGSIDLSILLFDKIDKLFN